MTRVCSGCGLHSCEGRCYLESPADYPPTCPGCDRPFNGNGYCKACESVERDLRFTIELQKKARVA